MLHNAVQAMTIVGNFDRTLSGQVIAEMVIAAIVTSTRFITSISSALLVYIFSPSFPSHPSPESPSRDRYRLRESHRVAGMAFDWRQRAWDERG